METGHRSALSAAKYQCASLGCGNGDCLILRNQTQQRQTDGVHNIVHIGAQGTQKMPGNPIDHQLNGGESLFHQQRRGMLPVAQGRFALAEVFRWKM